MPVSDRISKQVDHLISSNSPATLMGARGVLRFNSVPAPVVYIVIIAVVASWIPLAYAVRAKFSKSDVPRVHLFLDMDEQPRYEAQDRNPVFANEMAMRPPIPGTVARGQLDLDDFFERGYRITGQSEEGVYEVEFFNGFPGQVEVTPELLARGKELYARYCYLCHGYDGYGNGPIHVRAIANPGKNAKWVQPSNLHDDVRRERPTGHLYNTINVGIRNMAGYGPVIPDPLDRWAIVAYVQALQLSQDAPQDLLPAGMENQVPVQPTRMSGAELIAIAETEEAEGNILEGTEQEGSATEADTPQQDQP